MKRNRIKELEELKQLPPSMAVDLLIVLFSSNAVPEYIELDKIIVN